MMLLVLACALPLVSQTAVSDGNQTMNVSGKVQVMQVHVEMAFDFEKMAAASKAGVHGTQEIPHVGSIETVGNSSMIMVTSPDGSASMHMHTHAKSVLPGQPPHVIENCHKSEIKDVGAAGDIRSCLQGLADALKPAYSKDGLDYYQEHVQEATSSINITAAFDKEGLLHTAEMSQHVQLPNQPDLTQTMQLPFWQTKGADEKLFVVDPAWNCTDSGSPSPIPPDAPPAAKAVYHCFVKTLRRFQAKAIVV